jgi:sigma-B regulation protein RsbU (phosphoserine phosphatase)
LDRVAQELRLAGDIQSSLLPYTFPSIPGWQLSVSLTPAGDMAGDFFDIIPLSDGKVGIVIADVLDKGLGPALYMALSRTLIRTYATEFDLSPDTVFFATNERILTDTRANLFVTAFYGILDPDTGTLTYCNAGHNPPYLLSTQNERQVQTLGRTGIPIGIDEDATWEHATAQLSPGDCLLLYTDGVPDAANGDGEFFEEQKMVEVVKQNLGRTAEEIQTTIMTEINQFVGEAPPTDDITLMVLIRDT